MAKTLISDQIKNVYQKLLFYLTSDQKLYKTTEDGNHTDEEITRIANSLTYTGSNTFLGSTTLDGSITGTSIKDEDDMTSDSATSLATQQSIKAYVNSAISASIPDPITISITGSNNGIRFTGEQNKWALISACSGDVADTLLVFVFFQDSGASTYKVLGGSAFSFNSKSGLTISFIGLSTGQKVFIQRIGGDSTVSAVQAELTP